MNADLLQPILTSIFVAIAAGLVGSFAILKRMALVGDAMSHVALPGITIALLFNLNPFFGAVVFLIMAVVGIWFIQYRSNLSIETIVGVFFTASLALGAIIAPKHELLEILFGNITKLSQQESLISIILSIFLIAVILKIRKDLALNTVSSEMAQSIGIKNRRIEFIYMMIFVLIVALGIRFVGALLMGSLVIIPAASAKNIAKSLNSFMGLSAAFGVLAAAAGIYISLIYNFAPGPVFIIISAAIFIVSLIVKSGRVSIQ